MRNLGPTELIIILVMVIVIFGAGKLANLGGAMGKGVKDFREAVRDESTKPDEEVASATARGAGSAVAATESRSKEKEGDQEV